MSEQQTPGVRDSDGCFNARPDVEAMRLLKKQRLRAILQFARTEKFTTQADLREWLYAHGCGCTQGQLSKDIEQLGLAPYIDRAGNKRLGRRTSIISEQVEERYVKIFQEAVLHGEVFGNSVVLTTVPGCSQAVATVIEAAGWLEVKALYCGLSNVTILCADEQCADEIFDRTREGYL